MGLRNPWGLRGLTDQRGLRGRANPWGLPIQSDQLGRSGLWFRSDLTGLWGRSAQPHHGHQKPQQKPRHLTG